MYYVSFTILLIATTFQITRGSKDWIPYEGKEYFASVNQGDFSFAQKECKAREGQLAILHHNDRYLFVRNWLNDNADQNSTFFINVFRNVTPSAFAWGDGTLFPIGAKWGPGQPTQSRTEDGPFNCVALRHKINKFWMNDVMCNDVRYHYICERDIVVKSHSWSEWGSWAPCSSSCSPGFRVRNRSCVNRNSTGENSCLPISSGTQRKTCNMHLCNATTLSTSACNGSCGEAGFRYSSLVCQLNQTLPEECRDAMIIPCTPLCTETAQAVYNTPGGLSKLTTSESITSESSSEAPFKLPVGPIVGGTIAGIVLVFFLIVFCCIFVTSRKKMKSLPSGKDKTPYSQRESVKSLDNTYEAVRFIKKSVTLDERPELPERSPMKRNGSLPAVNVSFKPHKHTSNGDCKINQPKPINKHLILGRNSALKRDPVLTDDSKVVFVSMSELQRSPVKAVTTIPNNADDIGSENDSKKLFTSHTFPRTKSQSEKSSSNIQTTEHIRSQQTEAKNKDASAIADYITVTIPEPQEQSSESEIRSDSFIVSSNDATVSISESQSEQVASYNKAPSLEFDYITVERVIKDQNKEYDKVQKPKPTNEQSSYSYDSLLPR